MTPEQQHSTKVFFALCPASTMSRPAQYEIAWANLTCSKPPEVGWNCKTWLTYRACEGQITLKDYQKFIAPTRPARLSANHLQIRWSVSLLSAELTLHVLHYGFDAAAGTAFAEIQRAMQWRADETLPDPSTAHQWLKFRAMMLYAAHLQGEQITTDRISSILNGYTAALKCDWRIHGERFNNVGNDADPIRAILKIAEFHKLADGHLINPTESKSLFAKCLYVMGQKCSDQSRVLWTDPDKPKIQSRAIIGSMVPDGGLFIELGVAKGIFAEALLCLHPKLKYIGIDKWDDDRHPAREALEARNRLKAFKDRASILQAPFEDAIKVVPDADVIYVDGYAHKAGEQQQMLNDWFGKVKPGGILAGHDYDEIAWTANYMRVRTFAADHGLEINVIRGDQYPSWWVRKP
jgi:hypothetical protein